MKFKQLFLRALALIVFITSCSSDDNNEITPRGDYENGILVVNEGNFGSGDASITYISNTLETVENTIFENVNGELLGDTAQSIAFNGDVAYIVVNVSNKIEVVNRYTFESIATIDSGLVNPRYMTIVNGKGYVTTWGDFNDQADDAVVVINLTSNTIIETIATSYLPERLVANGNKIYVNTGTFGFGNMVDVIDASTDSVITSITVGNGPNSLQLDATGNVWVLSSESLVEINTTTDAISKTLPDSSGTASYLSFANGNLYYYASGSVYQVETSASSLPTTAIIDGLSFYDMTVNAGMLYGLDAGDFSSNGMLKIYDLSSNTEAAAIPVGLIPGEVYFN